MASGNPNIAKAGEKTRWKPGQTGNPSGPKPGYKHINTWVQELVEDETFVTTVREGLQIKEYKGAPIKAMIKAQILLAINGDTNAFNAITKAGWSQKQEVDATVRTVTPIMSLEDLNALPGNNSNQES